MASRTLKAAIAYLTPEAVAAIVDGLLKDPACIVDAYKYLDDLELTDPALFKMIAETTNYLPAMSDADLASLLLPMQEIIKNPTVNISEYGATMRVYEGGRLKYKCAYCEKLHDRKSRADDCFNVNLGLRPHVCQGECGKEDCDQSYALEQLLTRHWIPKKERMKKCKQCRLEVSKHNWARHMDSCLKHPNT